MPRKTDHTKKYLPADKGFWINTDDPDLKPIWIPLPDEPKDKTTIVNYGLAPKDQKFIHPETPEKLLAIERDTKLKHPRTAWTHILDNLDDYEEEYNWIEDNWDKIINGYWIYIKGKPYFITGKHYFTICFWKPEGTVMTYRDRDRRFWHCLRFCFDDPDCFGMVWPKHRREGLTTRASSDMYVDSIIHAYWNIGIQSYNEKNAKDNVLGMIKKGWRNCPFWLQPAYSGHKNPSRMLEWQAVKEKDHALGDIHYLNTRIMVEVADAYAFDGFKLKKIFIDEAGKTTETDVHERHGVIKECLVEGNNIVGKALYGSTVEEMDSRGGANFKKICDQSHYDSDDDRYKKSSEGRTLSGLYLFFIPADDGYASAIDEWGFSIRDLAKRQINAQRKALLDAGDMAGFASFRRKYPLQYRECWMSSGTSPNFDVKILSDRIDEIRLEGKTLAVRGDLEWENGIKDTKVVFIPNDNGRFYVSKKFDETKLNRFVSFPKKGGGTFRAPPEDTGLVAGGDPFKFDEKKGVKSKKSEGGGSVFWERDTELDPDDKPIMEWESHRFVCDYLFKPETLDEYCEDMLMMCFYFGAQMDHENNINALEKHFIRRGYQGYLYYNDDPLTGKKAPKSGTWTNDDEIEKIFAAYQRYIKIHGMREHHLRILLQCQEIEDKMGDYDLFTAGGRGLRAAEKNYEAKRVYKERWQIASPAEAGGFNVFKSYNI